jgi:hypothetical protein
MKALKVYENKLFRPKTPEEVKRDLPYDDFREMVKIGNERIHQDLPKDIDFPVISDVWVEIYRQNYQDPDRTDEDRPIYHGKMDLSYSYSAGHLKNPFYWLRIKYKNKNFVFAQEEGDDFMTPITKAGNPLYIHKIYNFEDLLKYLEENYSSR